MRTLAVGRGMLAAALLLAATALTGLAAPAQAATRTVHLTGNGPSPAALALSPGDRVVFVNDDVVPHQVRSQGAWQFDSGPLPPRQTSAATPVLTIATTYRYVDTRGVVVAPQSFAGSLVVRAPAKPSPRPSPTSSPRPDETTGPRPTPSQSRPASPTPDQATPGPTQVPTEAPTAPGQSATPNPTPSAMPVPSASNPTPAPDLRYGAARSLVQSSPHRFGLPVLLAIVAIVGVASLLGRYLLAQPSGRPPS